MSESAKVIPLPSKQQPKDLYEVGEIPPLGHVPAKMHAWAIRRERHGAPEQGHAARSRADAADRQPTKCWSS